MRARLDEEMGTPPAGGIDVDALIARGRRQVRARRVATIGGGAGLSVVALGTAVALAFVGTGGAPSTSSPAVPSSAPASSAGTSSPSPTSGVGSVGGGIVPPDPTPQNADEKRLSIVVKELVRRYAPGYTAARDGSGREPLEVRSAIVWRDGKWTPTDPRYQASADITVRGGTGNFYIGFGRLRGDFTVSADCADLASANAAECTEAIGPAHERIVKVIEKSGGGSAFIVYVTRRDGTGVALIAESETTPVFSLDELVSIGTDQRLRL